MIKLDFTNHISSTMSTTNIEKRSHYPKYTLIQAKTKDRIPKDLMSKWDKLIKLESKLLSQQKALTIKQRELTAERKSITSEKHALRTKIGVALKKRK